MPRRPPVEDLQAQRGRAEATARPQRLNRAAMRAKITQAQRAAHRKRALRIGELAMAAGLAHVSDEVLVEAFLVLATRLGKQGMDEDRKARDH